MRKSTIILLMLFVLPFFSQAQSSWLTSNFKSYLDDNEISEYISRASSIIDDLHGTEKEVSEDVLDLFKMMAGQNVSLSAAEFNKARNLVGVRFYGKTINSNLTLHSCSYGGYNILIISNSDTQNGYMTHFKATSRIGNSYSTTSKQRGIGRNRYASFAREKESKDYQFEKAEKLESYW